MAAARAELKVLVRVMPAFVPPSVIWYRNIHPSVGGKLTNEVVALHLRFPTPAAPIHRGAHDIGQIQTRTPRDSAGLGGG